MRSPLHTFVVFLLIAFIMGGIGGWLVHQRVGHSNTDVSASGIFDSTPTEREMEKELVRMDIDELGGRIGLSPRQQAAYLVYIDAASTKYNIPIILIHTIICSESSYDPSARHPQVFVGGKPTYAIGLMGVMFEYNSAALIAEGIITSRLDLTEPDRNIMAGTFILSKDIQAIFVKNPNLPEDRFFDELVKRYYGAYDDGYKAHVLAKIKEMASKQWIRRVVKTILLKYKMEMPKSTAHNDSSQSGKVLSSVKIHTAKLHKVPVVFSPLQSVSRIDTSHIRVVTTPITTVIQITPMGFIPIINY